MAEMQTCGVLNNTVTGGSIIVGERNGPLLPMLTFKLRLPVHTARERSRSQDTGLHFKGELQ